MHARLIIHKLRESFWFLPALMTIAAIALSGLMLTLDRSFQFQWTQMTPWTQGLGLQNARLVMSTIAGSMITVTSLVFSLTFVALSLASTQLGPRLLSLFMRDRMTQTVLGVFVSTFVFTLLVLASLGDRRDADVVPALSIVVALLLTLLSFGLLISFIHHLATSLHADVVVARMGKVLCSQISRMFCEDKKVQEIVELPDIEWQFDSLIASETGGYVQAIDTEAMVTVACINECVITMQCAVGQFMCSGEPIARLQRNDNEDEELAKEIRNCVVLGSTRTQAEDLEFCFQAIIDIGLRALSPGINDPYTAMTCIDRLGEAVTITFRGELPDHRHRDPQGRIRVQSIPLTLEKVFETAFNDMRLAAEGKVAILIRLAETYSRLAILANTSEQKKIIRHHAQLLARSCDRSIVEGYDQDEIHRQLGEIEVSLLRRAFQPSPT